MKSFPTVTIVGLGLMGGSLALALKKSGYEGTILGVDTAGGNLAEALAAKAIDSAAASLEEAIVEEGLIVVAAPLRAYPAIFRELARAAGGRRVVVTDVGSVKTCVHQLAETVLPDGAVFIGGHPMAGSERGGFAAARAELFQEACYFLTPAACHEQESLRTLQALVRRLGASPVLITPEEHDRVAARVSHVPHLLAALLASSLSAAEVPFTGSGFRDTTRIAAGEPQLWQDILLHNREEILSGLAGLESALHQVKAALRSGDQPGLAAFLQQAKLVRDGLSPGDKQPLATASPPGADRLADFSRSPGNAAKRGVVSTTPPGYSL